MSNLATILDKLDPDATLIDRNGEEWTADNLRDAIREPDDMARSEEDYVLDASGIWLLVDGFRTDRTEYRIKGAT